MFSFRHESVVTYGSLEKNQEERKKAIDKVASKSRQKRLPKEAGTVIVAIWTARFKARGGSGLRDSRALYHDTPDAPMLPGDKKTREKRMVNGP